MVKNPKYANFLQRFKDDTTLYGMAIEFVVNNGYNAIRNMNKDEFDKAINTERSFLGTEWADKVFAAVKDIVNSVSPLMLVAIVGNECYPLTYLQELYGSSVSRGEAVCPVCGGNLFKDTEKAAIICIECNTRIPLYEIETLQQKVNSYITPKQREYWNEDYRVQQDFLKMTLFIEEQGDVIGWDDKMFREALRKRWTVYCINSGVNFDTPNHDGEIEEVWAKVSKVCEGHQIQIPEYWKTLEQFKDDMSRALKILEKE